MRRSRFAGNLTDPIAPSVAVEFDTHQNAFDPDGNHVALIVDGKIAQHAAVASLPCPLSVPGSPGCLNSGAPVYVWVDYGVTAAQRLEVFVNSRATKPLAALLVRDGLNLASLGDKLYFGFTAATGIGTNVHEVLSWALSAPLAPGDLNGDNAVTCADLGIVKRALGKPECRLADPNGMRWPGRSRSCATPAGWECRHRGGCEGRS